MSEDSLLALLRNSNEVAAACLLKHYYYNPSIILVSLSGHWRLFQPSI